MDIARLGTPLCARHSCHELVFKTQQRKLDRNPTCTPILLYAIDAVRVEPRFGYDALPAVGYLAASPIAEGVPALLDSCLSSGAGAVLGRGASKSKLTDLRSAGFDRCVILFLSACSEMRLSSLTNDSPHQALDVVSSGPSPKPNIAYLVYLLMYLLNF